MAPGAEGVTAASGNAETSAQAAGRPHYGGVWLSRYEYHSSGRDRTLTGAHYVVGNVVTGTWVEQTATDGYYAGARYHGAVQLLAEPTGRRMAGKWVGFGKDFDVNTGPWELIFKEGSTAKETVERYSRRPE